GAEVLPEHVSSRVGNLYQPRFLSIQYVLTNLTEFHDQIAVPSRTASHALMHSPRSGDVTASTSEQTLVTRLMSALRALCGSWHSSNERSSTNFALDLRGERAPDTTLPDFRRLPVHQMETTLPDMPRSATAPGYHRLLVYEFSHGKAAATLPFILSLDECLSQLSKVIISKMVKAPSGAMLLSIFSRTDTMRQVETLCAHERKRLLATGDFPVPLGSEPSPRLRAAFLSAISSLLILLRAAEFGLTFDAMLRHEAARQMDRVRADMDDIHWLRSALNCFQGYVAVWGEELTRRVI
ncbi:MAG: hypothetical protein GY894_02100, partial [Planctomycetes bacterium]|nr:hypothetical protein [Planctomycetota bacterium]